jgi:hypothetical protein
MKPTEFKNAWSLNSMPQYVFMVWCLGIGASLLHLQQLSHVNMDVSVHCMNFL